MLKILLILSLVVGSYFSGLAQNDAIQFLKKRSTQIKTIKTGAYHITTKMKHLFDTDTLEFTGKGFFEHQELEDTTLYKIQTYETHLNMSHLYLGAENNYYIVFHDEKLVEGWMTVPFTQIGTDRSIFKPLAFRNYIEKRVPESDSIWLEIDTLLKADVLCFLDRESPPTSEVKVANDLMKIYFNKNGLPFRMTTYIDLVDYGVNEYKDQEIHFLSTNIPLLSDMHKIYGERGYRYVDGLEAEKAQDEKRDSAQVQLGAIAPTWQATSYAGQVIDLDKVEAKLILLDFWYKGCFPCVQSIPLLNQLHHKYADKGLAIIGINPYQSDTTEILPFIKSKEMLHPNIYSPSIPKSYGVFAYPTYIFLDENHKVLRVQSGYGKGETDKEFEAFILNYLEEKNTTN